MGKAGEESFRELYSTSSKSRLAIAGPARAWEKCEERPEASRVPALKRGSILPDAAWPLLTALQICRTPKMREGGDHPFPAASGNNLSEKTPLPR